MLAGKTVLVSGASRGIGKATALELARQGANLVLLAQSSQALEEVQREVQQIGVKAWTCACEVSSYTQVEQTVQQAFEVFSHLDAVVNNAGTIEPISRFEASDPEKWARVLEINLLGAYHLCRAVVGHFLQRGSGTIVNLSSGAAYQALEGWSAYCVSKAALLMLTRSLAHELGPSGIQVFGLQPGVVDTQMQAAIRASGLNPISQLPREKLSDPHEPARVIAWLCSGQAQDLTGQDLSIRDAALRHRAGLEPLP